MCKRCKMQFKMCNRVQLLCNQCACIHSNRASHWKQCFAMRVHIKKIKPYVQTKNKYIQKYVHSKNMYIKKA